MVVKWRTVAAKFASCALRPAFKGPGAGAGLPTARACILALLVTAAVPAGGGEEPLFVEMEIFPPQELHVHGSSIVELPNGDLLACWFQGTGERWADDVAIMGARLVEGSDRWSEPFVMADVPEFPDINPTLFVDGRQRLWLLWYTVLANQWETSLLKYRISTDYAMPEGPPRWDWQEVLHVKPGGRTERGIQPDDAFVAAVERKLKEYVEYLESIDALPEDSEVRERLRGRVERILADARGENMIRAGRLYRADGGHEEAMLGYPHFRRLGWQTQNKPAIVSGGRMIVPLYSDGFSFSLMAFTDDWGRTWRFSEPLVGFGNIQPALTQKKDGTLVAYMRDNGPPPKRLHVSESRDRGETWSPVRFSELPNPGSGADIVALQNGNWLLVSNDTERGRHSLAASLSTDEGKSWAFQRHIERDLSEEHPASSHYPAIIQARDGTLHLTYSFHRTVPARAVDPGGQLRERARTIKYVRFNEAWVRQPAAR